MDPASFDVTIARTDAADLSVSYMTARRPAPDPWNMRDAALLRAIADEVERTQRHVDMVRFDPEDDLDEGIAGTRATIVWGENRSAADRMGLT